MSAGDGIGRPMLFQVTQVGSLEPLWPYVLALHVNPGSLQEQYTKNKNVVMTRGGFVEFNWPDDLDSLSADSTTGAFVGPDSGLTADSANPRYRIGGGAGIVRSFRGRHGTIAWERHADLLDLFRQNGHVFNGNGVPILRSQIMCIYDRGIYLGWFTTFEVTETGDLPFQFKVTWEFKVTQTKYRLPGENYVPGEELPDPVPGNSEVARDAENHVKNLGNVDQPIDSETLAATQPSPVTQEPKTQEELNSSAASRDRNVAP